MDFLFYTEQTVKELETYCSKELISIVFENFSQVGKIIEMKNGETPSRFWIITDYVYNQTILPINKFAVILSLSAIGGVIMIGNKTATGDVNVLNMLRDDYYISDSDYEYFIDTFFEFSQGKGKQFQVQKS